MIQPMPTQASSMHENRTQQRLVAIADDLRELPAETEWVEFKGNNNEPSAMGVRISALSNAARLADRDSAYMVWGIKDETHEIIATSFEPSKEMIQRMPLAFWLAQRLDPDPAFTFHVVLHPQGRVILLEIPAASQLPVHFDNRAYIRIGSATPPLRDYPER